MICPKCDSKIIEGGRFCPDCGNRLDSEIKIDPNIQAEDLEKSVDNSDKSLRGTIKHSLKLSHRTARTIILVTLVLALGTSIAYAAFYVYQNVYLPSQQSETVSTPTEESPESSYQITDKSLKVSIPSTDPNGKRESGIWHYDELSCADDNEALKAINSTIKEAMAKTAKDTESQNKELIECTLTREIKITHISDDYVCYVDCQDFTNGGAVTRTRNSVYFDLKTGKSVKPSTAIGKSAEELTKKSKEAVRIYLKDNPEYLDDETLNQEVIDLINLKPYERDLGLETSLLLTNKGIIWISSTAMLRYSGEIAHIVVEPSSKDLNIGDNVKKIPPLYLSPCEDSEE